MYVYANAIPLYIHVRFITTFMTASGYICVSLCALRVINPDANAHIFDVFVRAVSASECPLGLPSLLSGSFPSGCCHAV